VVDGLEAKTREIQSLHAAHGAAARGHCA
jgi:hypothetical protein